MVEGANVTASDVRTGELAVVLPPHAAIASVIASHGPFDAARGIINLSGLGKRRSRSYSARKQLSIRHL